MAIQDRLKRDRYGLYNKRTLNREQLISALSNKIDYNQITRRAKKLNLYYTFYHLISSVYTSSKYSHTYNQLIKDYHKRNLHKTKSWTYIVNLMILQYYYFKYNPNQYNNNFTTLAVSWYNISLFQMRKAILKNMVSNKEILPIKDYNALHTNGLYPFVKPMYYKHTIKRALVLYDILDNKLDY